MEAAEAIILTIITASTPLLLAAIGEREDPHDAFVSNEHESLAALPAGFAWGSCVLVISVVIY